MTKKESQSQGLLGLSPQKIGRNNGFRKNDPEDSYIPVALPTTHKYERMTWGQIIKFDEIIKTGYIEYRPNNIVSRFHVVDVIPFQYRDVLKGINIKNNLWVKFDIIVDRVSGVAKAFNVESTQIRSREYYHHSVTDPKKELLSSSIMKELENEQT